MKNQEKIPGKRQQKFPMLLAMEILPAPATSTQTWNILILHMARIVLKFFQFFKREIKKYEKLFFQFFKAEIKKYEKHFFQFVKAKKKMELSFLFFVGGNTKHKKLFSI